MTTLHQYLATIRPLISPTALERAANLPENVLGKHYLWVDGGKNGQPCPEKHADAIYKAMAVCVPPSYRYNDCGTLFFL